MSKFITQTRKTDKLNGTMAAGATSCTLLNGSFGAPSGKQIITIDYDVAAKSADFLCTINNTAVTNMVLLNGPDVEHTTGANVAMCAVDEHYNLIFDALEDGWVNPYETWTYASATTITVPSGATSRYAVGDKLKLTQTTVKYFYVTAVADTTLTVTGGSDYTLANTAITDNYYSRAVSPVGFPTYFNFNPSRAVSGGTAPTYTYHDRNIFWMNGRTVHGQIIWRNLSGGTAGNGTNPLTFTPPVTMSSTNYNSSFAVFGNGSCYEVDGTRVGVFVRYVSPSTMGFTNNASGVADITGNDQSSEGRYLNANFAYVV